jgi:hypothetical protein
MQFAGSKRIPYGRSVRPLIKSEHHLDELASQKDERAPQYEGDAIEQEMLRDRAKSNTRIVTMAYRFAAR